MVRRNRKRGYPRPAPISLDAGGAKGLNLQSLVNAANVWREYYNPLHQLTLSRAIALLQAAQRGLFADLQWTYKFVEERYPTLFALIERRASALLQLDYNFKVVSPDRLPPGVSPDLADAQARALRNAYEQVDNLKEAIEFLALATFRGYSHLEKIYHQGGALDPNAPDGAQNQSGALNATVPHGVRNQGGALDPNAPDGARNQSGALNTTVPYGVRNQGSTLNPHAPGGAQAVPAPKADLPGQLGLAGSVRPSQTSGWVVVHLEPVEQWHWTRKSLYAPWLYNANAMQTNFGVEVPLDRFIIREVKRPLDPIALISFIRSSLSQKDWDAFVEIYGLPGTVVIGPPHVPLGREADYQTAAENVAKGASGYLPNGSDVRFATEPRGANPFGEHLRRLDEQLVLAGTGGLLTMLAEGGSGMLAGTAHQETFEIIAKAEAQRISEVFQRQFDAEILSREFPGQPRLAYFELAANEETDVAMVIEQAFKLAQGGYEIDVNELSEKTGYKLQARAPVDKVAARAEVGDATIGHYSAALPEGLGHESKPEPK